MWNGKRQTVQTPHDRQLLDAFTSSFSPMELAFEMLERRRGEGELTSTSIMGLHHCVLLEQRVTSSVTVFVWRRAETIDTLKQ